MPRRRATPLAVTMGEPAGIGGEIALRAWAARRTEALAPFLLLDDPGRLAALSAELGLDVPVAAIEQAGQAAAVFERALPVLTQRLAVPVRPGQPDSANTPAVLAAIERAVALCRAGEAGALVTNPINKDVLYRAGFRYPGHTEYLAALCGETVKPVMLLACPALRVVPVTVHVALKQAIADLTPALIVTTALITHQALQRDFGIARPRLAVAGLNPHAGEAGSMGQEDIAIIAPAIAELRRRGLTVSGPLPPDTMFHAAARRGYDVAICMYHDQALIPIKTIDFDGGVNVTLGLPVVRTSPDHGTAFDIAGRGVANPASLIAALKLAATLADNRRHAAAAGSPAGD
jgi:4-hydroxythreonine-4-phosphate dehydrogenase